MTLPPPTRAEIDAKVQELLGAVPIEFRDDEMRRSVYKAALKAMLQTHPSYSATQQQASDIVHSVQQLPVQLGQEAKRIIPTHGDLNQINKGIIDKVHAKWLLASIAPLGPNHQVPERRALKHWHNGVLRVVESLHSSIKVGLLSPKAIKALAPYILGEASFSYLEAKIAATVTWADFVSLIDQYFGIPDSQLKRAFYRSSPAQGEGDAMFIRRMELTRAQLGCDAEASFNAFMPKLQLVFLERLEMVRRTRASYGAQEVDWELLVKFAEDELSGASIVNTSSAPVIHIMHTQPRPQPTEVPLHTPAQPPLVNPMNELPKPPPLQVLPRPPSQNTQGTNGKLRCVLCVKLGRDNCIHKLEDCYYNPRGRRFKREEYERKIAYLKRTNQHIPDEMRLPESGLGPTTPVRSPGQQINSIEGVEGFKSFLQKIGLSDTAVSTCVQQYENLQGNLSIEQECQHMFEDFALDEDTTGGDVQASLIDELILGPKEVGQQQHASEGSDKGKVYKEIQNLISGMLGAVSTGGKNDDDDDDIDMDVPLEVIRQNLNKRSVSAQTGGVGGRIFRLGGTTKAKQPKVQDLDAIVKRITFSIPVLRASITDNFLRNFILATLVAQNNKEGQATVLPGSLIVHQVGDDTFTKYREQLAGVTPENMYKVQQKLVELGIDGRGRMLQVTQQPTTSASTSQQIQSTQAMMQQLQSLDKLVGQLAGMDSEQTEHSQFIGEMQEVTNEVKKETLPDWADKGATNCLDQFRFNAVQYVSTVQLDTAITRALLDTGGHGSVIDLASAEKLGLDVTPAGPDSKFGHYHSPGYPARPYAGLIYGPVPVRFSQEVVLHIPYIRVIHSKRRLLILGADLLAGGRSQTNWNFQGIELRTAESGDVDGFIKFKRGQRVVSCPLHNVPRIRPHIADGATPHPTDLNQTQKKAVLDGEKRVTFQNDQIETSTDNLFPIFLNMYRAQVAAESGSQYVQPCNGQHG